MRSLLLLLFSPAILAAQVPLASSSTATCQEYSAVTCTGTDAGVNADICQLAADTRDQLTPILQLGHEWRFPVRVHIIMPDDPAADRIHDERVAVVVENNLLVLQAVAPVSDADLRSFVRRQFVTAMLWEKFFAGVKTFDLKTNLAVVPVWLIEGLSEWVRDDPGRDREEIVRRAAKIKRAPTLAEVTSWNDISPDRLLGLYQRAFCYYLTASLIHGEKKRAQFKQWLATLSTLGTRTANELFPTEADWQQELLAAPDRSHELVYTWDESATALADADAIAVQGKDKEDTRLGTLDTVLNFSPGKDLNAALQKKIFDLTALELRVHPSWHPVIELYRFGLAAVVENRRKDAVKYLRQAHERRLAEAGYHQKMIDYVNWFEVTKNYGTTTSRFQSYFETAEAMKRAQSDTTKPNPIRADLIRAESHL